MRVQDVPESPFSMKLSIFSESRWQIFYLHDKAMYFITLGFWFGLQLGRGDFGLQLGRGDFGLRCICVHICIKVNESWITYSQKDDLLNAILRSN